MNTVATEVEPGIWEWQTEGQTEEFRWRWTNQTFRVSHILLVTKDGGIQHYAVAESLDLAVAYTCGFTSGFNAATGE